MSECSLAGRRILVLEDEYIVAMLLETEINDAGAIVLGPLGKLHHTIEVIKSGDEAEPPTKQFIFGGYYLELLAMALAVIAVEQTNRLAIREEDIGKILAVDPIAVTAQQSECEAAACFVGNVARRSPLAILDMIVDELVDRLIERIQFRHEPTGPGYVVLEAGQAGDAAGEFVIEKTIALEL